MTSTTFLFSLMVSALASTATPSAAADFDYLQLRGAYGDQQAKALREIARCVVERYPDRAARAFDNWFDKPYESVPEKMLGGMSCGPGTYPFSFRMDGFLLMQMIAELLATPDVAGLQFPKAELAPASGWDFADCALATAPDEVSDVLKTPAFSPAELEAMQKLASKLAPCVGEKRTKSIAARGVRTGLRGYLAATVYRAQQAAKEGQNG